MIVDKIKRSMSIFRVERLGNHRLRPQCAVFKPLDDFREEMPVKPGADEREFLFDDLLLTDVAGRR